jgi:hypothetical protein
MKHLMRRFRPPGTCGSPDSLDPPSPFDSRHKARAARGVGRAIVLPVVVLIAVGLSGCASSNTTSLINLPNGETGFAVNCSGADASSSWASCYVQAGQACGATGYDIVSKDNDEGGAAGGGVTNVVSANVKNRSMIVRCK